MRNSIESDWYFQTFQREKTFHHSQEIQQEGTHADRLPNKHEKRY